MSRDKIAAGAALSVMEQWIDKVINTITPFRAIVVSIDGSGQIQIQHQSEDLADAGIEAYPRVAGFPVAVGDEIICLRTKSSIIVLGVIQKTVTKIYAKTEYFSASSPSGTTTSTDTVNPVVAHTFNITLPKGVWTITAMGMASFIHSASAAVQLRTAINSQVTGLSTSGNLSSTLYTPLIDADNELTLTLATTTVVPIDISFRPSTAGTATIRNCALWISYYRVDG